MTETKILAPIEGNSRIRRSLIGLGLTVAIYLLPACSEMPEIPQDDLTLHVDLEQLDVAAIRNAKITMQQEGLLDESLLPVKHELIQLATVDRTTEETSGSIASSFKASSFFFVGSASGQLEGNLSGKKETNTFLRFAWTSNRNGQGVTTITQFPITENDNRIQFVVEEDPLKTHRVSFAGPDRSAEPGHSAITGLTT